MPFDNPIQVIVDPVVELLKAGKRRIQHYWIKGSIRSPFKNTRGHYGYCLVGSVMHNDDGTEMAPDINKVPTIVAANNYLNMAAKVLTQNEFGGAVGLNDDRKSIKEDALLCIEVAIELAERRVPIVK